MKITIERVKSNSKDKLIKDLIEDIDDLGEELVYEKDQGEIDRIKKSIDIREGILKRISLAY